MTALSCKITPPEDREVLWKNLCVIGWNSTECILEFSRSQKKFYIVAHELLLNRFHVIELFRQ